tara:strand:+ start:347 stop:1342 length:996 start_codon:yes stop_codon:yes gene_type:complete
MAFQDDCGDLIIDAVLTDIGRKKLIRGDLKVTSFALGDDEIDYSLLNTVACVDDFSNLANSPVLEAYGKSDVNIHYGLVSFPRDDVLYVPKLRLNELVENSAKKYKGKYYLAINEETVYKLKADVGIEYVLQENEVMYNHVLIENGIDLGSFSSAPKDFRAKKSYILNYELYDKYYYVHCDSRFFENILISNSTGEFRNTKSNKLINTLQPLQQTKKINTTSYTQGFSVYKAEAVDNQVYKRTDKTDDLIHSTINGPRSSILGLNFVCNRKLLTRADAEPDDRFERLGTLNVSPFPTNTKYDYIDTVVLIEGTVTKSQIKFPVRIIRYRSG